VNSYPIGLGATFDALADAGTRSVDVYVQGFNADMLITASMSGGGSTSLVVSPTHNPINDPNNDYSWGVFHVDYAGIGETLTISVLTQTPLSGAPQDAFANAGFFAATVNAVPEPSTWVLSMFGLASFAFVARRRRS
jgi:hypothetical protein